MCQRQHFPQTPSRQSGHYWHRLTHSCLQLKPRIPRLVQNNNNNKRPQIYQSQRKLYPRKPTRGIQIPDKTHCWKNKLRWHFHRGTPRYRPLLNPQEIVHVLLWILFWRQITFSQQTTPQPAANSTVLPRLPASPSKQSVHQIFASPSLPLPNSLSHILSMILFLLFLLIILVLVQRAWVGVLGSRIDSIHSGLDPVLQI